MSAKKTAMTARSKPSPDESPPPPRSAERASTAPQCASVRLLDDALAALRGKGIDEGQLAALCERNAPEALARLNAERRAAGIEDEVLFIANSPEEMGTILDADGPPVFRGGASQLMAFLNADEPCASSS